MERHYAGIDTQMLSSDKDGTHAAEDGCRENTSRPNSNSPSHFDYCILSIRKTLRYMVRMLLLLLVVTALDMAIFAKDLHLSRLGVDLFFQQAPATDLHFAVDSDYYIALGHQRVTILNARCSLLYRRGDTYKKRFGSMNVDQTAMYETLVNLDFDVYHVLRDMLWDLIHWRMSSGRVLTISCDQIVVSLNVWGVFPIAMSVPSMVSQDINFEAETVDASIETWIFPALYVSVPFHEEMNAPSKANDHGWDNNDMEGRLRNMTSHTHSSLIGLEVVEEDGFRDTTAYIGDLSAQILRSVMNTLHVQNSTSESLNFEWNLTVSTDGIFQATGGVRVENFNVHFPVTSFTVDKTGPKVDGWTLTSDEFSFDVVKGATTRQRFSMSCNKDGHNINGCTFYRPRFMSSQMEKEFEDYQHVNVTANALTENLFAY